MKLLSIDPSLRHCGYAIFEDRTLLNYGILESSVEPWQDAANDIGDQILNRLFKPFLCYEVIIEMPTEIHSPGGHAVMHSGALGKLFFTVGLFYGLLAAETSDVFLIPVRNWKGQLPKQLTTQRVNKKYHTKFNWRTKQHNIADAVALGDWYITKGKPSAR